MARPEKHIFCCVNSRPPGHPKGSCTANGGQDVLMELVRELEDRELFGRFRVTRTGCLGPCDLGPIVLVYPEAVMYGGVQPEDVAEIVEEHLLGNRPVERLKVPEMVWE